MASHLSQRGSSLEATSGKLSLHTSEQSNHWDSPTPPMDHHIATLKDAEEAQSVIDEKRSDDPNLITWTGPDDPRIHTIGPQLARLVYQVFGCTGTS